MAVGYDGATNKGFVSIHNGSATRNDAMTFDVTTGNIGIGTTSPLSRLHVDSTVSVVSNFNITTNTNALIAFQVAAVDKAYLMWNYNDAGSGVGTSMHLQNSAGKLHLAAAGSAADLTIINGGNVGIGTTVPENKLDILLASGDGIRLG